MPNVKEINKHAYWIMTQESGWYVLFLGLPDAKEYF